MPTSSKWEAKGPLFQQGMWQYGACGLHDLGN